MCNNFHANYINEFSIYFRSNPIHTHKSTKNVMKMLFILTFLIIGRSLGFPTREEHPIVESDGETSRKVLGSR